MGDVGKGVLLAVLQYFGLGLTFQKRNIYPWLSMIRSKRSGT